MSYTVALWCGCTVYVACNPQTRVAHSRVIERRGPQCRIRTHEVGTRLWLWELLPDPRSVDQPTIVEERTI
jgi:hypothetical protein